MPCPCQHERLRPCQLPRSCIERCVSLRLEWETEGLKCCGAPVLSLEVNIQRWVVCLGSEIWETAGVLRVVVGKLFAFLMYSQH